MIWRAGRVALFPGAIPVTAPELAVTGWAARGSPYAWRAGSVSHVPGAMRVAAPALAVAE